MRIENLLNIHSTAHVNQKDDCYLLTSLCQHPLQRSVHQIAYYSYTDLRALVLERELVQLILLIERAIDLMMCHDQYRYLDSKMDFHTIY